MSSISVRMRSSPQLYLDNKASLLAYDIVLVSLVWVIVVIISVNVIKLSMSKLVFVYDFTITLTSQLAVFPKGLFFRLFRDHNSCRCAVWRP